MSKDTGDDDKDNVLFKKLRKLINLIVIVVSTNTSSFPVSVLSVLRVQVNLQY